MRRVLAASLLAAAAVFVLGRLAIAQKPSEPDVRDRVVKAREVAQSFADRIRSELHHGMKSGGPVATIPACQTLSPDLAASISTSSGFEVTRVALRVRNPDNAPDPWEQSVLESFQRKVQDGADAAKLEYYEIVTTDEGDKLFRYMKAIPTQEICLACHGTEIKREVLIEISRYYPEDKATGFKLNDLRGAFSLVQPIE